MAWRYVVTASDNSISTNFDKSDSLGISWLKSYRRARSYV